MEAEVAATQDEPLLEKGVQRSAVAQPATGRCPLWLWAIQILLAAASLTTFAMSRRSCGCSSQLSTPSPALEAVPDSRYQWQHFRGTVLTNSTYKGPPTAERRAAWDALTRFRYVAIDEAARRRTDAPASAVAIPEHMEAEAGTGAGYFAVLEMYHQLHCLQELWLNTYPAAARGDDDEDHMAVDDALHHQHLDHCADILRQKLLCDADVTPVTFNWVRHVSHATPNFNVLHRCRRPEDVDEWATRHEIPGADNYLHHKPQGVTELEDFP